MFLYAQMKMRVFITHFSQNMTIILFCLNVSVATQHHHRVFFISASLLNSWDTQGSVCTLDTERLSVVTLHLYNNASIHLASMKHFDFHWAGAAAESCNFPG